MVIYARLLYTKRILIGYVILRIFEKIIYRKFLVIYVFYSFYIMLWNVNTIVFEINIFVRLLKILEHGIILKID